MKSLPWKRASGEFLVIFLGVTLSLVADDWRQDREVRAAAIRLVEALDADLREDSSSLEVILGYTARVDTAALWVSQALADPDAPPDQAELAANFRRLYSRRHYDPVRAAYSGAKDAGQLSLIRDPEVRRVIVQYHEMRQPTMQQLQGTMFSLHARAMELAGPHFRFEVADSARSYREGFGVAFEASWPELVNTPDLRRRVDMFGLEAANWYRRTTEMLELNVELRSLLDGGHVDGYR